jgi:hypothetical protein
MGLLNYRIEKAESDSLFQSIARLSLANDSDKLIERMLCLYPDPHNNSTSAFQKLAEPDLYQTHLWDITPECQVVGVADEDNTVLIDNCRALSIRWKNFPRMSVVRHHGFKKLLAELFVASGAWWFLFGFNLTVLRFPRRPPRNYSPTRPDLHRSRFLRRRCAAQFLRPLLNSTALRRTGLAKFPESDWIRRCPPTLQTRTANLRQQ